jgi:catechol 2,3-dioxygenase-like lactoylglutathione lyase family enzyme
MSEESSLTLDHIALVTPDLAASKQDYERLGFQLTPQSSHKGKVSPDGPVEPWGSGNHCAMFRQGYFEILGITDPDLYHEHFRVLLDRFHGVQMVALGCESAEAFYETHRKRVPELREPVEIGRDVPYGNGTKEGLFRLVHVEEGAFPEADLVFIEHATPNVLWQKDLLVHPNRATALSGITFCSKEPAATADRFERLTDRAPSEDGDGFVFSLDEGEVRVDGPDEIARRYRSAVLPAVPCVAVATLSVYALDETKAFLRDNEITPHESEGAVWVKPERAGGVILEFKD